MPARFSGPWQSFGSEERQNFLGGATSGMGFGEQLQAATYPSTGDGKGSGETLELTLFLMEQRHKRVSIL